MTEPSLAWLLLEQCQRSIDKDVLQRTRLHVLDWMGCVLGAAGEAQAQKLAPALSKQSGHTPSFGLGPLQFDAALTYSTALGNLLEMDDLARTALLHPGPVVVPAAIYSALQHDCNYAELLDAVVRGYEAATRLGNSVDAFHYQRWHPTSTAGVAGAAVASATLRKLDNEQQLSALCNALSVSGGLWHMRHGNSMTKQWHSVHTVQTALSAVQAAENGFTAAESIIEGPQGWHQVFAEQASTDAITKTADWSIQTTSFKPWPACRHCHAAIDAALAIRDLINGKSIAKIEIQTYQDAQVFCDKTNPATPAEARFSLQHCVAIALANGTVSPHDFATNALDKPAIVHLRERTIVSCDDALSASYPAHFGTSLNIQTEDGKEHRWEIHDAMGDPEWPLSQQQIRNKFDMLCDWGIGSSDGNGSRDRDRTNRRMKAHNLADSVLGAPLDIKVTQLLESAP